MVTSTKRVNGLTVCGILAAGALTVGTAGASTLPIKYAGLNGSSSSVTVNTLDWFNYESHTTRAGAMSWNKTDSRGNVIPGTTFTAYCIELDQTTSNDSQVYDSSTNVAARIGSDDAEAIAKLWYHYDAGKLTGDTATAFQLAVWNLVYDTANDYSLKKGYFTVSSMPDSVKDIADGMLDWLDRYSCNAPLATLSVLTSCDFQDQITGQVPGAGTNPVPEPATLGIGLLALAGTGFMGRKRR